jgi:hypothetical protein
MVRDELGLPDEHDPRFDKVMACQVACTNPDVFDHWPLFNVVALAFNGHSPNFRFLHPVEPAEAAFACVCLRALAPHQWGGEVEQFLGVLCLEHGITFFPWLGGEGLLICKTKWSKGLVDADVCSAGAVVKEKWDAGLLTNVDHTDDVDWDDSVQAQFEKVVQIQSYINAWGPA